MRRKKKGKKESILNFDDILDESASIWNVIEERGRGMGSSGNLFIKKLTCG